MEEVKMLEFNQGNLSLSLKKDEDTFMLTMNENGCVIYKEHFSQYEEASRKWHHFVEAVTPAE